MYNNKYSDQLLPLITPEMLSRYPDQTCEILNKLIRLTQQSSGATVVEGGTGNLEDIIQTTTSYDDGGVNVVTAYLSDGTTQDFQIRNGHKGSQGEDGESATIAVGTTSTLPAGSSATVVNSGTSSAAVLDFGIPKGDTGADGQDGADGFSPIANVTKVGDTATITITDENGTTTASVTDGTDGTSATVAAGTTTTLPAGSSATVTNSGTSSAAVFDFGIPKGDTGAAGQDGADGFSPIATVNKVGDTATITITDENGTTTASVTDGSDGAPGAAATISAGTTTTLPAGSSATVTNSGTSSAAVFDFGIPKGDTGAAGADGYSPTASVSKVGDTATITITDQNGTTTATVTDGAAGSAATISAGTTTTLPAGSSATVTNSGTSSAAVFDFGIPKGDTGSAATVAVGTTTTLSPGSSATVTNSGTSSAAVFDFGIPEGEKGDPGKGLPIGAIIPYTGNLLPEGYLECDGSAVSRTTYADLFAVIGTSYGAGDGSTTFNLPDLRGKVTVGQDTNDSDFDTLGETGGEKAHTLIKDEMPAHTHKTLLKSPGNGAAGGSSWFVDAGTAGSSGNIQWESSSVGGDQAHNNLQPYTVTKYLIKYRDMANAIAEVHDSYNESISDVYSTSYINRVLNGTNDLLNLIYPVGSIYMSVNNVSPAVFIGGTWEPWGEGRVPIGMGSNGTTTYNTVEDTGGSDSVTLTSDNLPTHTHSYDKADSTSGSTALTSGQLPKMSGSFRVTDNVGRNGVYSAIQDASGMVSLAGWNHAMVNAAVASVVSGTVNDIVNIKFGNNEGHTHSVSTTSTSSGDGGFNNDAVENRQSYITCYMWKRTA